MSLAPSGLLSSAMAMIPQRGKIRVPLSIVVLVVCCFAFFGLLYTERVSLLSSPSSVFKLKSCSRRDALNRSKNRDGEEGIENSEVVDDRFEFDPEECNVADGKWVYNSSITPLYTDRSCPYLERQVTCVKNGRPETEYLHWEWQSEDCTLPRFDPQLALNKLRGKRLLFAGDSLQRGQWLSFICMVDSIIPQRKKSFRFGRTHSVFKAKEYNASIEFYWAPYIVESNTDQPVIADAKKRIIKVDEIGERSKHWEGVDVLVFNTYVWWMSGLRIKALWGSFANGPDGAEQLQTPVAYRLALKTWANWVDSTINPNKTRVFFTTMSPTHTRSEDWGKKNGTKCFNETRPITKRNHWGTGSNKEMMKVVKSVIGKMKTHVTFLNITQISEYRIDGHTTVYTETGGKILTEEQRADPLQYADCIHWCLPGIPDTWNQIFLAHL